MKPASALLRVFLMTSFVACSHARVLGNFVQNPRAEDQDAMALDVAKLIKQLYAPAKSCLTLTQPADDQFGLTLVAILRRDGYAIEESSSAANREQLAMSYVVDRVDTVFRVTLWVRSDQTTLSLTRAYLPQAGVLQPAGAWARQTGSGAPWTSTTIR